MAATQIIKGIIEVNKNAVKSLLKYFLLTLNSCNHFTSLILNITLYSPVYTCTDLISPHWKALYVAHIQV